MKWPWSKKEGREGPAANPHRVRTYYYEDTKRLNKLYEQIGTGFIAAKLKQTGSSLSLTGPTAKVDQTESLRTTTNYEKVDALIDALAKRGQLGYDRPFGNSPEQKRQVYRVESCEASRLVLTGQDEKDAVCLWVSRREPFGSLSILILIESLPKSNEKSRIFSAHTFLSQLLVHASPRLGSFGAFSLLDKITDSDAAFRAISDAIVADPIGFFVEAGAKLQPKRIVETLYYIRDSFVYPFDANGCQVVIGYPIYVAEAKPESIQDLDPFQNDAGQISYSDKEIARYAEDSKREALEDGASLADAEAAGQRMREIFEEARKSKDIDALTRSLISSPETQRQLYPEHANDGAE